MVYSIALIGKDAIPHKGLSKSHGSGRTRGKGQHSGAWAWGIRPGRAHCVGVGSRPEWLSRRRPAAFSMRSPRPNGVPRNTPLPGFTFWINAAVPPDVSIKKHVFLQMAYFNLLGDIHPRFRIPTMNLGWCCAPESQMAVLIEVAWRV
ncbi:hypothetical protein FRB93_008447 [Tulasnella sp. JGI-2019a]|nr:hypothetical protein FRB93_008447 [Tulasnella sp. JGI-2019a]